MKPKLKLESSIMQENAKKQKCPIRTFLSLSAMFLTTVRYYKFYCFLRFNTANERANRAKITAYVAGSGT